MDFSRSKAPKLSYIFSLRFLPKVWKHFQYVDLAATSFSLKVYFGDPNSKFPYRLVYCKRKKSILFGRGLPVQPTIRISPPPPTHMELITG